MSDTGYSPPQWEFDEEVTRVFDDMLERSIPQHETMRSAVASLVYKLAQKHSTIVDLGCARGESIERSIDEVHHSVEFLGVERSQPMLSAARQRLCPGFLEQERVRIIDFDLRHGYPTQDPVSVTLSILTLMFVPINYRAELVRQAYEMTVAGGAFILVEKVLGESGPLDLLFQDLYHAKKMESGYTQEDVDRKKLALEGVLVPVTGEWNEAILRQAGFLHIDCFWRWMNFAGWVAVK